MRWLWLLSLLACGCGAFASPGIACRKHEECSGLKNGYCARAEICTRECSEAAPCPENSACSQQGARSVCLSKCATDNGCLKNFTCVDSVCVLRDPLAPPPTN